MFEHRGYRCVYKLVDNLVYMIATDIDSSEVDGWILFPFENALSLLSFIDVFVETLELYFSKLVGVDPLL